MTAASSPRPKARGGRVAPHEPLEAYAVRLGGGAGIWLRSPQALLDVLRSLELSLDYARQKHAPRPDRVLQLVADLQAELGEAIAASGNAAMPQIADLPPSRPMQDPIESEEAAAMLKLKPRQVRNLAPELGGQRVRGRWLFERVDVEAEAHRRGTTTEGRR